ncbi:30S ribosomal protein S14 [Pelagibius litoralis]|uniref:Small ribosomal subunit protein uS14 n=1 Tax=Pelagibius litoralis TaxID=374515 RepID=A0A967F3M1_9PROT|nr:30S ribosomal protein S14 [Pelagibius litoralis]NIA72398.1 30S ribosomal protein S14 [Pelagibius litoralis]
MAKKSAVEKNKARRKLVDRYAGRRAALKVTARDRTLPPEERFQAYLKLAELPRNSAKGRIRNRCQVTGRPRGVYRKFELSRISLRDLASVGQIPGMVKSSW